MNRNLITRIITSIIITFLSFFFIIKGNFLFVFFLISLYLLSIVEWFYLSKKIVLFILGLFLLTFSFFTAYSLRVENIFYFIFVITVCVSSDIGGYIFGKLFKGPKLTKISPNKTYSGMIGSFFLAFIIGNAYVKYFYDYFQIFIVNVELYIILLLIFFISVTNQIGDLIISYFKRKANVKDTGKILPGHGGLLDRIDGIIFAIPLSYFLKLSFL